MIAYRPSRSPLAVLAALREITKKAESSDPLDLLIDFGELESAVEDAQESGQFRKAAIGLAGLVINPTLENRQRFLTALNQPRAVPAYATSSVSEGYAFYALHPRQYIKAADLFYEETRPIQAVVIGIRTIGTSLSAVVAARLEQLGVAVKSLTVRPVGHPFDRRVNLPASRPGPKYVIVDEGPGLSGSSFASVANALHGIPDQDIVFFPSWNADPDRFNNQQAASRWRRHKKYVVPSSEHGHFIGLGRYGAHKLERARQLAADGWSPGVLGFHDGFIEYELIQGPPVIDLDRVASYLTYRKRTFPAQRSLAFDDFLEMIQVNTGRCHLDNMRREFEDRGATEIDGRMMRDRWIHTPRGLLKADAIDQHASHFYPGCVDIAWDLAGAIVELKLNTAALLDRYHRASGDRVSPTVMNFYLTAYRAFRRAHA